MELETADFLGIIFRDVNHLGWFLKTQAIFWPLTISMLIFAWLQYSQYQVLTFLCLLFVAFHGLIAYVAYQKTGGGQYVNDLLSPDCIWYNKYMALSYLIAIVLASLIQKRPNRKLNPTHPE